MHCHLNCEGAAVKWLYFVVVFRLCLEQYCLILERVSYVWVVWPIHCLLISVSTAVKRLCSVVLGLIHERMCQIAESGGHVWVIWPIYCLPNS